jgi:hypothetical protein
MEKRNILVYLIVVIFIITKIFLYNFEENDIRKLKSYTEKTTGIVTVFDYNVSRQHSHIYKYDISIDYQINEEKYTSKQQYTFYTGLLSSARAYNVGNLLNVLYQPENPYNVIPEGIVQNQLEHHESYKKVHMVHIILGFVGIFIYYERTKKNGTIQYI